MNGLHYYSQRKAIKDGASQPVTNKYGTAVDMEYQYHLFCASAAKNEADNEYERIEWGTIEHGIIEAKTYDHPAEPESESEPEEA